MRRRQSNQGQRKRKAPRQHQIQRETRPVRVVGSPTTQTAPPRVPAPVMYKEPKYVDTSNIATAASSTLTVISVSATTNGTTDITRIGDQIELHSLELKLSATVSSSDGSNLVRILVFQWLADDTTDPPTAAKVLQSSAGQPYNSPFNHDNSAKLVVLYDKLLATSTYYPVKHDSVLISLGQSPVRRVVKYSAGASTGNNNIYIAFCSDSGPAPHPTVDSYARINFYDC